MGRKTQETPESDEGRNMMALFLFLILLIVSGCVPQLAPVGPVLYDEGISNPILVGIENRLEVNVTTMNDVRGLLGEPSTKMTTNTKEGVWIFWIYQDTSIYFGSGDMLTVAFNKDGLMQSATRFGVQ